jgi:hypothetical protein
MSPSNLFDCVTPHCPLLADFSGVLRGTDPVMLGNGPGQYSMSSHFISAPISLLGPTVATFEAFQQSVAVLLGKAFAPFLLIIQTLEPQLLSWFKVVIHDAIQFSLPACPLQDLSGIDFPYPILGSLTVTIADENAFSPLHDMRHDLGWSLNCYHILSMGKPGLFCYLPSVW